MMQAAQDLLSFPALTLKARTICVGFRRKSGGTLFFRQRYGPIEILKGQGFVRLMSLPGNGPKPV